MNNNNELDMLYAMFSLTVGVFNSFCSCILECKDGDEFLSLPQEKQQELLNKEIKAQAFFNILSVHQSNILAKIAEMKGDK